MKKRSNDAKSNPGYNSSGRSGNVVDRQLIQRVEQYMEENKDRPVISICQMAQELHTQYREYTRKKMTPFRIAVENAYISVCNRRQSEHEIKDSLTVLEEKHLKKRQRLSVPKKSSSSSSDEDDKSFSSNADDYVQYPESNLMNSVITDMYRKKASGVGIRSGSAEETACPVVSTSSGLSYCIDRTGVPPVHTMPESDQHQPSVSSSGSLTVDSVKATATTQGESAADDIIVIEDGRDHDNNLLTRVNMPEHSTTVDVRGHCSSEEKLAKKDVATRATYRGKSRKRSLPESTDKEPTSRKKFGFEVQQSTTRISEFGGSVTAVWEVIDNMLHMKQSAVRRLGVAFPRGILLHGPPGCGKTLLANAVAGEVGCSFIKMSSTQLISGVSGDSEERIRDLFDLAVEQAPCIIFLDEIDAIAPKRDTASKDMERRIVAQLLTCMDDLYGKPDVSVVVIGATNRPDALDPALRRAGRFDQEVSVGIPDETARMLILKVLCEKVRLSPDIDLRYLAQLTPGYVGVDLRFLVTKAGQICIKRLLQESQCTEATLTEGAAITDTTATSRELSEDDNRSSASAGAVISGTSTSVTADPSASQSCIEHQTNQLAAALRWLREDVDIPDSQLYIALSDFEAALRQSQPSSKREGFATVPNVTWDHIGALQSVRRELQKSIIWPIKYPHSYRSRGARHCGILLTGPPGNGKTLVAKAVANELGLNFISVKGPELLSMYVGESERAVRQVFQRAADSSPCVIFFDELDSLFQQRRNSDSGGNKVNVVNQLLTELDGFDSRKQVYVIGATNRLDLIDAAFLRPGRFDKTLYIGLPDSAGRYDILLALSRSTSSPFLSSDVDLAAVAENPQCHGMSGADLCRVLVEAEHTAMEEIMSSIVGDSNAQPPVAVVHQQHLEAVLQRVTPSVKDQARYEKMRKKFGLV